MTLKVFVYTRNSTLPVDELRCLPPSNIELTASDEFPSAADFEILVHGFPTRDQVEASPNLRAVIAPFAGTPKETIELLRDYPHVSLHSVRYNVAATAELAIGLMMLATSKFIIPLDRELRSNDWRSRYGKTSVIVLEGRTVTILGYGRIGHRIATVCQALGMKVVGVRRHASNGNNAPLNATTPIFPPSAIPELLPHSDILISALPLTTETEGMIGQQELAMLPTGAIVVNVGRGPVIDEEALYNALHTKSLLGAGLDVWYQYPQRIEERMNTAPSRFPFHTLDNVVMSPHRGGFLSAAEGNRVTELASLLTTAAQGHPIPSYSKPIEKRRGYSPTGQTC